MLAVVLGAIRRRPAQAALLVVLAFVASAGAAAAPGYVAAGAQSLAASAARSAQPGERVVSVNGVASLPTGSIRAAQVALDTIRSRMALPGFASVTDVRTTGRVGRDQAVLAYRESACDMVVLVGRCPTAAGEVALAAELADKLGVGPDTDLALVLSSPNRPARLRAVGVFRPQSPYDVYWGRSPSTKDRPMPGDRLHAGLLLTPLATFATLPSEVSVQVAVDYIATAEAFRNTDPQQLVLASWRGRDALAPGGYRMGSDLLKLADRVWLDQRVMILGVPLGALQLMVLCWFALFLAMRQMGEQRREDVAKLKLHGARRSDLWGFVAGQSILPLLVGGAAGLAAGPALARWVAGDVRGEELRRLIGYAGIGGAVLAVVGAILAALVAERRMIAEPVSELGRRIVGRRRRWRTGVIDAVVVTMALAAGYQLWRASSTDEEARGLATAAPVLAALAAGLLAARAVPVVAGAVASALAGGRRLGAWLVAVQLSRRSGHSPVLALLTVAVAVLLTGVVNWDVSATARDHRAVMEVGADRVLTVRVSSRAALVEAVRAADPEGRYAMAAVQTHSTLPFLAVDSTRLAAVVPWQPEYGAPAWSDLVNAIRPRVPAPVTVAGPGVRLDATWQAGEGPADITVRYVTAAGQTGAVRLGPLRAGRHEYAAPMPDCGPEHPCRLVSFGLTGTGPPPAQGSTLRLHSLAQSGPEAAVVTVEDFQDRTRWRNDVNGRARAPILSTVENGLSVRIAPTPDSPGVDAGWPAAVFVFDAPAPLPAVAAGVLPLTGDVGDERAAPFGSAQAPVRVIQRFPLLPRLGAAGLLADLDYADRLLPGEPTVGTFQVWLGRHAPDAILDRLAASGVTVQTVDSLGDRLGDLAAHGPPLTLRFLVLVAAAGILLASGSFGVWAAADGGPRAAEMAALRRQGLTRGAVRAAALGEYLAVVAAAALVGAAVAGVMYARARPAVFADGWTLFGEPSPRPAVGFVAFGLAVGPLALTALVGALAMLRGARRSVGAR